MGYVLRVRFASFFVGAAVASLAGLYVLREDYKTAHQALSRQMNQLYESMDGRISSLENIKKAESASQVDIAE